MKRLLPLVLLLAGILQACDVPVIRPGESGLGDAAVSAGDCPRGLVVAATNNQTTNIGLAGLEGQVLVPSLISSGSQDPGLTAALGGDIGLPSAPTQSDELVILDRYPKGVVTWVNWRTSQVRAQLSVATGFLSNPHDYVSLTASKSYVTRFDLNPNPGREAFDGGGDIVIVDPSVPAITGRIDLSLAFPEARGFRVHPDRARWHNGLVFVVLPFYDSTFHAGDSYLAVIDPRTDSVTRSFMLSGLSGCSGLDVSPNGETLAVACSGGWRATLSADPATSAIVGIRLAPDLAEVWRVKATQIGPRAFGFDVAFADDTHVIATQLGELGPPQVNDTAFLIDIRANSATAVLESANTPVSLSLGPCNLKCGACYIADATRNLLFNVGLSTSAAVTLEGVPWTDPVGLPPRALAFF